MTRRRIPMANVRVGFIGCGGIANGKHFPGMSTQEGVDMCAFCDLIIERAEKAARELRNNGIRTDVYLSPEHKSKRIFEYAEKNSIPYSLSFKENSVALKCHKTRETKEYSGVSEAVEGIII